ncbi:hypothetical protein [Streptomyces sp. NBC_01240]|uniref:hypothetical protein n=1 Tax=Streptomyces sp. NBC_01240 TaxID=2903793 RepID=UPI002E0EF193|nr:hypothetical protein OG466_40910 [Streptomyces sp. NBC_01240]
MSPRKKQDQEETRLPPAVTFTSGAQLLVKLGIVPSITREGIRHIATSKLYADKWPFGIDKPYPYGEAGNALLMATEPFLEFFRTTYKKPGPAQDGQKRDKE